MRTDIRATAIYCRLSDEDDLQGDSNSITHQREMLTNYAIEHGFENLQYYIDDGLTGTNYNREAFQKLINDVENSLVSTVIVKDLSRLGREHIFADYYTQIMFVEHDVRFIAVTDNIDTQSDSPSNQMMPLLNFFNEFIAHDISKKQKAVVDLRGNAGIPLSTSPIYGYKKDEQGKWFIDEAAAETVRTIFNAYVNEDKGLTQIANELYAKKLLTPSAYSGKVKAGTIAEKDPYLWQAQTVGMILDHQEYCGDVVNFRTTKKSFKSKKITRNDKADYVIFKDKHPAIIEREMFEKAQAKREARTRRSTKRGTALFADILFCADCGRKMYIQRSRYGSKYLCSGFGKAIRECTGHYVKEELLSEYVLGNIQAVLSKAKNEPKAFKRLVTDKVERESASRYGNLKERYAETEQEVQRYVKLMENLYADKVSGDIPKEAFATLISDFSKKRNELTQQLRELHVKMLGCEKEKDRVTKFLSVIRKYETIDTLTYEILHDFVEKVCVHESPRGTVKADIYFAGVGVIDLG